MMEGLRIGEVAHRAGVSTATVRYYERSGIMPKPRRSAAGYRLYAERAVNELVFIRKAQALGFSLDEIGSLLSLSRRGEAPCARVISLATDHVALLDERIRQLQTFRQQLAAALDTWRAGQCGFASDGLCDLVHDITPGDARPVPSLHAHGPVRRNGPRAGAGERHREV